MLYFFNEFGSSRGFGPGDGVERKGCEDGKGTRDGEGRRDAWNKETSERGSSRLVVVISTFRWVKSCKAFALASGHKTPSQCPAMTALQRSQNTSLNPIYKSKIN